MSVLEILNYAHEITMEDKIDFFNLNDCPSRSSRWKCR